MRNAYGLLVRNSEFQQFLNLTVVKLRNYPIKSVGTNHKVLLKNIKKYISQNNFLCYQLRKSKSSKVDTPLYRVKFFCVFFNLQKILTFQSIYLHFITDVPYKFQI